MFMHPYISRDSPVSGSATCSRTPSGCTPPGGCTPNPEQPRTVSSPGSAYAVPCVSRWTAGGSGASRRPTSRNSGTVRVAERLAAAQRT